jgi:uncharacterized membrane protein
VEVLIGLVFLGASLAVAFVLPVISFLRATQANRRSDTLAREIEALRAEIAALRAAPAAAQPGAVPEAADGTARAAWIAEVRDMAAHPVAPHTSMTPAHAPDAADTGGMSMPGVLDARDGPVGANTAPLVQAAPDASLPDQPHPAGPKPESRVASPEGLEERIGARWLLYAGIGALILGVSYFIKFAFDNGWVSEPLRVTIGVLAGAALVVAGQRFVRHGLAFFGHALSGGGLVVLYIAIYAALHVYALIGPTTAFVGMVGVTLLATALADRHRLQVLGALAVFGGFVTPALVGGRQDSQIVLFTYNAILLAGALLLVVRHSWAGVAALAYLLAGAMAAVWADSFYTPAAWLRTLVFLSVHLALVMAMLVVLRRRLATPASPAWAVIARPVTWLLLTAPLVYHVAALAMLGRFHGRLLVYLLLATVAGLSASYHAGWRWARTLVLALVALPLITWMQELQAPGWYSGAIVTACAVYLLHLAGQWRDLSDDAPGATVPLAELVHTHATGMFLPLALYLFIDERFGWWNAPMLTLLAAWNGALAAALRLRIPMLALQFGALAATMTAVAVAEWFDGPVVAIGWALEAAALGYAALRTRRTWLGGASYALFLVGAVRLVDLLVRPMPVGTLPVVNTRMLATAFVVGAMAWLATRQQRAADGREGPLGRHVLIIGAHVLAIGWVSAEIALVFGERAYASSAAGLPASAARAELAQQVALSVAWALYAVALVAVGFRRAYAPARYLAIALFGLTIVKVVTKDIAELDRVYQMLSVLGVGVLLVAASYLYQHMTKRPSDAGS